MRKGNRMIAGLQDALAYARGDKARAREYVVAVPQHIDVRAIRSRLKMSQEEFALNFGFSLATLKNWEQGHRQPEGPARVLLTLIDRIPHEVQEALRAAA